MFAATGARTRSGCADRDRVPRIHCRRPCVAQRHARPMEYGARRRPRAVFRHSLRAGYMGVCAAGGEIRRNPEAIGFGILLLLQQTEGAEQQFLARMQLCAVRKNTLPDFRRKCVKTVVSCLINGQQCCKIAEILHENSPRDSVWTRGEQAIRKNFWEK